MKKLLKNIFELWICSNCILVADVFISFYTFFTIIFAECIYIYFVQKLSNALPIIIILLCYIMIILILSFLKSTKFKWRKMFISILYAILFITTFIVGCIVDFLVILVSTLFPIAITLLFVIIRKLQFGNYYLVRKNHPKKFAANKFLNHTIVFFASHILTIGLPIFIFILSIIKTDFHVFAKIGIVGGYVIIVPIICCLETLFSENIFELAYKFPHKKDNEQIVKVVKDY